MLVKTIPLPADAGTRSTDWPSAVEPTPAQLAALEAQLVPVTNALDHKLSKHPTRTTPGVLAGLSTGELIDLAVDGSKEAFGPLFQRFAPDMVRAAFRRTRDYALAEDIVSEIWVQVLTMIGRWERRSPNIEDDFRRLLFGRTRQAVAAHYASFWRETAVADFTGDETPAGAVVGGGETPVNPQTAQLRAKLLAGIDGLCDRQRDVVNLLLDGFSMAEIADHLHLSLLQVQGAKQTAEAQLRAKLADPLDEATVEQLRDAIALLPDPHRQIMYMRVIEGLGMRRIAEVTGLDYTKVLQVATMARLNVRRTLASPVAHGVGDLDAARAKREQKLAKLREAAQQLAPAQRQVTLMRLDGKLLREIADETGKTIAGVDGVWRAAQNSLTRLGALADGSTVPTGPATAGLREANPLGDLDAARTKRQQEIDTVRQNVQVLPPVQREVAMLRLDGLTFTEIGKTLGKSKAAVVSAWRAGQASLARPADRPARAEVSARPNTQLAAFLQAENIADKQLARLIGAGPAQVVRWISGQQKPRPVTAKRITDTLARRTGRPLSLQELGFDAQAA